MEPYGVYLIIQIFRMRKLRKTSGGHPPDRYSLSYLRGVCLDLPRAEMGVGGVFTPLAKVIARLSPFPLLSRLWSAPTSWDLRLGVAIAPRCRFSGFGGVSEAQMQESGPASAWRMTNRDAPVTTVSNLREGRLPLPAGSTSKDAAYSELGSWPFRAAWRWLRCWWKGLVTVARGGR